MQIDTSHLSVLQQIKVSVEITNTGNMRGEEVVQLYFKDLVSSVTTYESQLRGFERISLNALETKTVEFSLSLIDFELLNKKWIGL